MGLFQAAGLFVAAIVIYGFAVAFLWAKQRIDYLNKRVLKLEGRTDARARNIEHRLDRLEGKAVS